jgi:hypothetical protein
VGHQHLIADLETPATTKAWLSLTCGVMRDLGIRVLTDIGVNARQINVETTSQHNGYDDGHAAMEMQDPSTGEWLLVDLDLGYMFRDYGTGRYLSAIDFRTAVLENRKPEFVALSSGETDPRWVEAGFNYSPWFRWRLATAEDRWEWYRRVFQKFAE